MKKFIQLFVISGILFSITSCNLHIEKRRYRKGYYIDVTHHHKNHAQQHSVQNLKKPEVVDSSVNVVYESATLKDSLVKIATKPNQEQKTIIHQTNSEQKKRIIHKRGNECDIITFMDGRQEEVVVEEITETEIKYKKCNFKDGPSYRISKSKVKKIDLFNGEVYVPEKTKNTSDGKVTGGTITSMVLGILAFIFMIAGAVLAFFGGFIGTIGLAPAGILSLVGLIVGATQLKKGAHKLAWFAFILNLVVQILAIIFTVIMFIA